MRINSIDFKKNLNTNFVAKNNKKTATKTLRQETKEFAPVVNSNIYFGRSKKEHESWGVTFNKDNTVNFKMFTFSNAKNVYLEVLDDEKNTYLDNVDRRDILVERRPDMSVKEITPKNNESRIVKLENKGEGIFEGKNIQAKDGQYYRVIVVKNDNVIEKVKDPYSKSQPHIMGWSRMRDPNSYKWNDKNWMDGKDPRRITRKNNKLGSLRIYELNIPTITSEGTFESAKKVIKEIKEKNLANAIEIMPVENTYSKQWGYDGVDKFAINEKMGSADEFKSLIDYAHSLGLNVIIDMVPNHMGTDGDMLGRTGPYERGHGSFGAMFNYEGKDNKYVRDWMANAALNWALEYHADGIRFDMTKPQYMGSDFTLKQIVAEVNEHAPHVFTIAEDGMNNREKTTTPIISSGNHIQDIEKIDKQIWRIQNGQGIDRLDDIGFDSEWDFVYLDRLRRALIYPEPIDIDLFDSAMKYSRHRVKYSASHDEIGNLDGTSPIVKYATAQLGLAYCVDGKNQAEVGQRAAHATQKLLTLYAEDQLDQMSGQDFADYVKDLGIKRQISKEEIKSVYDYAFAKAKLATGTLYSTPGPKMYFQGMENNGMDYFKFFRKLSSDENPTPETIARKRSFDLEKGYDSDFKTCIKDSTVGNIRYAGEVKEKMQMAEQYTKDLSEIVDTNPALTNGEIVHTVNHSGNKIHLAHMATKGARKNEIIAIKNFSDNAYQSYGIEFPAGKWVEIMNSDDKKYAGSGEFSNSHRILNSNRPSKHFIKMNGNSVLYFKKVN